ncbi:hypothetical protein [Streptomyces sp. CA-111067]|uniref:hypothetical protein n=1 Tax=Streptomyces sp. CA-111067 TaxID=3240046 RepID=UPI003D994F78
MPGLMDLAYTTAGGVVGAAVTNYLSRNQERRQLRAAVMQQLHHVAAVRDGVCAIVPGRRGRPAQYFVGQRPPATGQFRVTAVLDDDRDAEHALREVISDLVVAALSAGLPRRVLDFAAGGEERALQSEVIRLIDLRLGGVLGEPLDELMAHSEQYRNATAQLLLQALWRPWQTRWRTRSRLRALRRDVDALHREQQAAVAALSGHADVLAVRLRPEPDGTDGPAGPDRRPEPPRAGG